MNEEQASVRDWHKRFGVLVNDKPTIVSVDTAKLRHDLILEEFNELVNAMISEDLVAIADALGDLKYVVDGTAVSYGIDLEEIFREIHRSNMSKGDPEVVRAPNGKILKSRNFTPPNLAPIIQRQLRWTYDGINWRCSSCNKLAAEVSTGGDNPLCRNCKEIEKGKQKTL